MSAFSPGLPRTKNSLVPSAVSLGSYSSSSLLIIPSSSRAGFHSTSRGVVRAEGRRIVSASV